MIKKLREWFWRQPLVWHGIAANIVVCLVFTGVMALFVYVLLPIYEREMRAYTAEKLTRNTVNNK